MINVESNFPPTKFEKQFHSAYVVFTLSTKIGYKRNLIKIINSIINLIKKKKTNSNITLKNFKMYFVCI